MTERPSPRWPPSFEAVHFHEQLLQAEVHSNFWRHLERRPPMTLALVVVILWLHVAVGAVDWWLGIGGPWELLFGGRSPTALTLFGGRETTAVAEGEVWRLISCVFLHAGLLHVGLNTLALYGLGRICEALYGPNRLLWLFLVSGICGAAASQLGGAMPGGQIDAAPLSVGASGGVFGLMGAGVAFGLYRRSVLPPTLRQLFGRSLLPWVGLNLFIGAAVPRIDNLAHLGGLIGGAVCALLLSDRLIPRASPPGEGRWMLAVAGIALLVTGVAAATSVAEGLQALEPLRPLL